jgi:hypothetical protein
MQGDTTKPDLVGMIPRALQAVWEIMRSRSQTFRISVSMIEIYNEALQDMFVPTTPDEARLRHPAAVLCPPSL